MASAGQRPLGLAELSGPAEWREEKGVGRRLPGEGEADRATTAEPRKMRRQAFRARKGKRGSISLCILFSFS